MQRAGHQDQLDPECGQYWCGVFEAKVLHELDQSLVIFMKGSMQSKEEAHPRSLEGTEAEGAQTFLSTANSVRPTWGSSGSQPHWQSQPFSLGPFCWHNPPALQSFSRGFSWLQLLDKLSRIFLWQVQTWTGSLRKKS